MTLAEAVAKFETGRNVYHQDGNHSLSATNEEYATVVSGGQRGEGEMLPCFCTTEAHAVRLWYEAALQYAKDKTGRLYWRCRPQLDSEKFKSPSDGENDQTLLYSVYSRMLVSDKPIVGTAFIIR